MNRRPDSSVLRETRFPEVPRPTRSSLRGLAMVVGLLAGGVLLAGCGYRTTELYPEQVSTVAVPIVTNATPYRGLERRVTEALIKEIEFRTPYKVAAASQADTLIEGTIVAVEQSLLHRTQTGGLPEQMEMIVTIDLTWRDRRSGEVLRQRPGMQVAGRYVPTRPVAETFETGETEVAQRVAEQFVAAMRGDW